MKPFKFFFGLAIGVIVFLFLARVLFTAVIIAAVLSLIYYVARGAMNFFRRLDWESRYNYAPQMGEASANLLSSPMQQRHYNPYEHRYDQATPNIIKIS